MRNFKIRVIEDDKEYIINARENENLLTLLNKDNIQIHSPCGGRGTCKKCTVEIMGKGKVLACQTYLGPDLLLENYNEITVYVENKTEHMILTDIKLPKHEINPLIKSSKIKLQTPSVSDQTPDDERVCNATGKCVPINMLSQLSRFLREEDFEFTYFYRNDFDEITSFQKSTNKSKVQGLAIDIGSTTLAGISFDLNTGDTLKISSRLNSQKKHGADIISRIDFADSSYENLKELQNLIYNDIIELCFNLSENVNDIKLISFSGNTTMMHLLSAINPVAIAKAPFIPTTLSEKVCYFTQLFNNMEDKMLFDPLCILLPSISGYVGADITAGILTCNLDNAPNPSFLVDIGTNGEIALTNNGKITACSTAAGPAFEGANLSCGVGGVVGAIDEVVIDKDKVKYTTIGGKPPLGICGSGVVSALSSLIKANIVDETGRFEDELDNLSEHLRERLIEISGQKSFVFYFDENNKAKVYLTQKDIRELQNAKAALCAGIEILMEKEDLSSEDIDKVYIAGGFGNFLNMEDAFTIGMIPKGLKGKTIMAGNTSLSGAALCLLDINTLNRTIKIKQKTKYYELSSDKRFTDLYIDAMMF